MSASSMLFALLMLLVTGCSKEEVVAPTVLPQVSKAMKPVQATNDDGGTTIIPGISDKGISPITDDGDDQGDRERSNKPKP